MRFAGLIYNDSPHYLDHLGPFCALLRCPLIICEPHIADLARTYYPDLEVIETSLWDVKLPFQTVSCDNQPIIEAAFPHQKTNFLWLPHGNSDKGWHGSFFEGVGDTAFVYGQKMIDFMHKKKAYPRIIRVGNFRWSYFQKHQLFYQKMIPLPKANNVLYAPTWDEDCSLWKELARVVDCFKTQTLLIKVHPNTIIQHEAKLEILMGQYSKHKNVHFLALIPPIYPILSQCEAYVGDMSSIGYDFLTFNKPLYFLQKEADLPLFACGACLGEGEGNYSKIRQRTYDATFDPVPDWEHVKEQIDALCRI